MVKGDLRLAKKRDDYAYRAEKITEHGENLIVGNIPRVELCGVVVGVALRRERRCFGYTAAVPERIRECARRSWRKCGSVVKLYVAIRTCFHNIVSLVL